RWQVVKPAVRFGNGVPEHRVICSIDYNGRSLNRGTEESSVSPEFCVGSGAFVVAIAKLLAYFVISCKMIALLESSFGRTDAIRNLTQVGLFSVRVLPAFRWGEGNLAA